MDNLVKIASVEAEKGFTVKFTIADGAHRVAHFKRGDVEIRDGRHRRADLTGLIARSRHFGRFLADKHAFKRVHVTEFGGGIEWENGLDLSAETLMTISDEQRAMSSKEFVSYLQALGLNDAEAAHILECSPRTLRTYKSEKAVPTYVSMIVRRCAEEPNFLAALYQPIEVAPRGRPKSLAKH